MKRKSTKDSTAFNNHNNKGDSDGGLHLKGGLDEIESLFCKKKKAKIHTNKESKQKKKQAESNRDRKDSAPSSAYWTDDGLGGKFNAEGYTGRIQDGCRIFKAHVLNKPSSGNTKDCPFECSCCFI